MPTRRQLLTGGTGGGLALLTAIWFALTGEPERPETSGEPVTTEDDDDDPPEPTPEFAIAADVDRRSQVLVTHEIGVTVTVENVGDAAGKSKHTVTLSHEAEDGYRVEEPGSVSLAPDETARVEYEFGFEEAGPHAVALGTKEIDRFDVHPARGGPSVPDPDPWVGAGGEGEFDGGEQRSDGSES